MSESSPLRAGQVVVGTAFDEPMRVETVNYAGASAWVVGLVGVRSERFRKVTLSPSELETLTILDESKSFAGDPRLLRLGLQAYALGMAYEFDPYFGLSISRVDPLPHQLEAVYEYLLRVARVRFLLADDAGAGKTIMAGLLVRELKLRGLADRVLVVVPANLAFQWQRELKEKFDEKFIVLKGRDIREQFGVNQWLEQNQIITSLDLAKRQDILPGLRQVNWDLVVVDEAHRMSASDESHKSMRYRLGELLRETTDHLLLLTATPHRGDPENFSLFLQLLDQDAYADVRSIRQAMERRYAPFYLRRTKEAMVYFPQRLPDGSWAAQPIFTKRIPRTVGFSIDDAEDQLYRDVTRFVKQQSAQAAARGDDPRARAVGFLMALYQRRLASSTLEEDSRLVALFLWTLQSTAGLNGSTDAENAGEADEEEPAEDAGEDDEGGSRARKPKGFTLVYDVVRRFAQPLGIHLEDWERRIIETKKGSVRLLPVQERATQLFGEDGAHAAADQLEAPAASPQLSLFPEMQMEPRPRRGRRRVVVTAGDDAVAGRRGATTLDRVHAAMLLQASGRANALRSLLAAEVERGPEFMRLANALSALYPRGSEEKRLLDAMLLAVPR